MIQLVKFPVHQPVKPVQRASVEPSIYKEVKKLGTDLALIALGIKRN